MSRFPEEMKVDSVGGWVVAVCTGLGLGCCCSGGNSERSS